MNIISFANSKGGVGKTTSCLSVACCLAELNYKVLCLDLDYQGNLSDDLGRGSEAYTITDLFEDPKFDINKIIYPAQDNNNIINNLWIIPADTTLAAGVRVAEKLRHRLFVLEDGFKKIKMNFDFLLLDLRPAIDLTVENALMVTDLLVIPVNLDVRALKGIDDLLEVAKEVKRIENVNYIITITQLDKRNKIMLSEIENQLSKRKYKVTNSKIRISEDFKHASLKKRPSVIYASKKPHEDYMKLTRELLEL